MNQLQMIDELERIVASLKEKVAIEQRIEKSQMGNSAALFKLADYLFREQQSAAQIVKDNRFEHYDESEAEYYKIRSQIFQEVYNQLDVFISQSR
jgi:hypothetical protein